MSQPRRLKAAHGCRGPGGRGRRTDVATPTGEGGARRSWSWRPMVARGGRGPARRRRRRCRSVSAEPSTRSRGLRGVLCSLSFFIRSGRGSCIHVFSLFLQCSDN